MVLEHMFPSLLERKPWAAFVLAVVCSCIALTLAHVLFVGSSLAAIGFTAILLLPLLQRAINREVRLVRKEQSFSLKKLYVDNKTSLFVYLGIFLGTYLTFAVYAFSFHAVGWHVDLLTRSVTGHASLLGGQFFAVLLNNWWVLLACFLVSLIAGDGAIFFVIWNASIWGLLFGVRAVDASIASDVSAPLILGAFILLTFPHVLLEGVSYILGAIAGSLLSDHVLMSKRVQEFALAFISAAIICGVLIALLSTISGPWFGVFAFVLLLCVIWLLRYALTLRERNTFTICYVLLLCGVGLVVIAAGVEILMLNASPLRSLYLLLPW